VDALRRRQEGASFDHDQPARYTLAVNNLVDVALREIFGSWRTDPVATEEQVLALKYHGFSAASQPYQRRVSNRRNLQARSSAH
jgi:hypothetical protein